MQSPCADHRFDPAVTPRVESPKPQGPTPPRSTTEYPGTCPPHPGSDQQPGAVLALGLSGTPRKVESPCRRPPRRSILDMHTPRRAPATEYRVVRPPTSRPATRQPGANARTGPDIPSGPFRATNPQHSTTTQQLTVSQNGSHKVHNRLAQNAGTEAFASLARASLRLIPTRRAFARAEMDEEPSAGRWLGLAESGRPMPSFLRHYR